MEVKLYEMDYEKPDLTDEFLEHHGIKGQKWGVRNGPPYPLSAGKSKKVRETYGGVSKRKKKKQQLKNLEKARQQRAKNVQERKETAQTKEEILKNRDSVAMLKNIDKFTTKEIQDFNTRELAISQLSQQAAKQIEKNMPKSQKLARWVKNTVTEGVKQAVQQAIKNLGQMAVKEIIKRLNVDSLKKAANMETSKEQREREEKEKKQKQQQAKNKNSKVKGEVEDNKFIKEIKWEDKNNKLSYDNRSKELKRVEKLTPDNFDKDKNYREFLKKVNNPMPEKTTDAETRDLMRMEYLDHLKTGKYTKGSKVNPEYDFPDLKNYSVKDVRENYWVDNNYNEKHLDEYLHLAKTIEKNSGDWYFSKPVSNGFKKYISEKEKINDQIDDLWKNRTIINKKSTDTKLRSLNDKKRKLDDDLCGTVLEDLGYEDTPKNRQWIFYTIFTD